MFKRFQRMPPDVAERVIAAARSHPMADSAVDYPPWYLQRWHFLPEGYLSERSAGRYEAGIGRLYNAASEDRVRRMVASALRARNALDIADLGCGAGGQLAAIERLVPGVRPVGVDLSPFMLARAAGRTASRLVHGDAGAVPLAAASFDAAVASHLLGHTDPSATAGIVAECARLLRPNGTLVVVDHAWHRLPLDGWRELGRRSFAGRAILLRVLERPCE